MVRRSKDLSRDVKVIHLTDLHVDRDYSGAGKGKCFLGICCKSTNETSDAQVDLGEWGDAQGCGVPLHTFQNLLQHINESHPDVDYIVWTGDTAAHDSWFQSPAANLETVHVVTELIQKALPDVPVYPAVGNHDIFPINQFPGSDEVVGSGDFWFYKSLASIWKEYIPEDQVQGFRTYGNFVVRPVEGLRIVVLNTNYCYKFNWFTYLDHSDPGKQLEWLDRELKSASDAGDHVHLVSHISPGDEDCLVTWTHHFLRLLHKYRGVVKAQFYGHDHDDRFQVMVGDNDTVLGVAFLGPSLTPLRKMNPAYRIYTVDAHSKEVKMLETWWMDLAEANRKGKPAWRRLYNTVTDYRFRPFTLQDWLGFVDDVRREESLFLDYYRHKSRNWPRPPESCNETCRTLNTCNMIVRDPIKYCGAERCKTKSPEECKDFDYY
ncbi:unnamed protein product [Darwinula stevensoni]|uniref:Sphingomyelin phosphodiesterase n=1 Tax=Darwinula stevensoni TaxID=69355 RepID=A0A7R9A3H0_9CRUS|nr:unnamed protein product [Darwinula stevensoni]CAG0891621.1 unnamed protein product [Darwinula stevensoni]